MPTALDLFCGAGGLSAGLATTGFNLVGAVDAWPVAVETYRRNFKHPVVCADLGLLSGGELREMLGLGALRPDLVAGGPPCQGFSVQRIGADRDIRNQLVLEFARFVLDLRPRVFLMENVMGLLGSRGRLLAQRFEEMLVTGGYVVNHRRVNAAEYGVPQQRNRVFFYGWERLAFRRWRFPAAERTPAEFRTTWDAIGDLPSPSRDYSPSPTDALHRRTRMSPLNQQRLALIPPGGGFEDLPADLRANCHRNGAARIGHRGVYGRLAPDRPSATITARFDSFTRGRFAHPYEDRNITLREGARLQTFPDFFKFVGSQEEIAAQIGNAVPPLLASVLGKSLVEYLDQQEGDLAGHQSGSAVQIGLQMGDLLA